MRKITILLLLIISILMSAAAFATAPEDSPEITPEPGQVNPYKTRAELLMEASDFTGVFTPRDAAIVWANGLKMRSAAMQYAVMTKKLKSEYAAQLDSARSNWVTGVSSPWVNSFAITENKSAGNRRAEISMIIELIDSSAKSRCYDARLWLVREGDFWRIERIWTDQMLCAYTFYTP